MTWLARLGNWFRTRRIPAFVYHIVGLTLALVLTYWLSQRYRLPSALVSPMPQLHAVWLPTLVLLAYLLGWLAYLLVRLTAESRDDSDTELIVAWDAGLARVRSAGIDLSRTPVILVLGRPTGGVGDLFAAAGGDYALRAAPTPGAAVEFYATKEAVFIVANIGATAALCDRTPIRTPFAPTSTRSPIDLLDALQTEPESTETTATSEPEAADWLPAPNAIDVTLDSFAAARLASLARLVRHIRRPYCPANGIIWLIPVRFTNDSIAAKQAAAAISTDQNTIDEVWGLILPHSVIVTDVESVTGFSVVAQAVPAAARQERLLGVTFPIDLAGSIDDRNRVVHDGITWLMRHLVGGMIAHRLSTTPESSHDAWRAFADLTHRAPHLARMVSQGIISNPVRAHRIVTIALAGTGPDVDNRLFAAAPLAAALHAENAVSWTAATLAADRTARRLALVVWLTVGLTVLGLIFIASR